MEIHQSISQNTLSFLVEKIFEFKVDSCQKSLVALAKNLFLVTFLHIWAYKHGRLARSNNQGDNKEKLSAVNRLP